MSDSSEGIYSIISTHKKLDFPFLSSFFSSSRERERNRENETKKKTSDFLIFSFKWENLLLTHKNMSGANKNQFRLAYRWEIKHKSRAEVYVRKTSLSKCMESRGTRSIFCPSQINYRKIKTRANRDGRIRAKREDKINRKNIFTMKTKLVVHKWFCRLSLLILYLRARDNLKTKSWDKFHILPVFLFYFFLLRNDEAFL